jgi:hypothetical protein
MILNTFPTDGFSIGTGPGNVASGAAVSFKPHTDCSLINATLLLQGYDGLNGQQISLQFCDNSPTNEPIPRTDFICPPHNDGSLASFAFNLQPPAALKAGSIYWIFIYGRLNAANFSHEIKLNWVNGVTPEGDFDFKGSLQFFQNSFSPSLICPAFKVSAVAV